MSEVEIRKANSADMEVLVPALARAFAPQPVTHWLVGSDVDALRRGERLVELEYEQALPYDLIYTTSDLCGAALWHPPDKKNDLRRDLMLAIHSAAEIRVGRNFISLVMLGLRLALNEPKERHFYLAILAVDPNVQGKGIGARLLAPVLERCDTQRMPSYLVTDTTRAVRFYQRLGFQVRRQIPIFRTSLSLWTMRRPPSA
ncbi:MAG TPA: GNAT family N-acetyltransferase, partial [Levilinea sp.]|nr:GNAT family N-acetyltransferase [Levilinea sp.]